MGSPHADSPLFESGLCERAETADLEKCLLTKASQKDAGTSKRRSRSWCDATARINGSEELQEQRRMREPGGFRRQHLHTQAEAKGIAIEDRPMAWEESLMEQKLIWTYLGRAFLHQMQVGHFITKIDSDGPSSDGPGDLGEELLPRSHSEDRLSDLGAAIAILKGNCGPASLLLAKAWSHGGVAVATPTYFILSTLATVCVAKLLVVHTRGKSLGDVVFDAAGPAGRLALNTSIVLLQSGVGIGYFIMVGDILRQQFFPEMSKAQAIVLELIVFVPLALIRKMQKLWFVNLIGVVAVLSGFAVSLYITITTASSVGKWDQVRATPESPVGYLTFLGTAVFSFEGIGLVIPIYETVENPQHFVWIYGAIYFALNILNSAVALSGYGAFGTSVEAPLFNSFPAGSLALYVRCAYALTMILTFPIMLLPATRLVESMFFETVRKPPLARKMKKNLFRAAWVCSVAALAIVGSSSLDLFISIIGAAAGIPITFCLPTLCHLALCKELTFGQRLFDYVTFSIGLMLAAAITVVNISLWFSGA